MKFNLENVHDGRVVLNVSKIVQVGERITLTERTSGNTYIAEVLDADYDDENWIWVELV